MSHLSLEGNFLNNCLYLFLYFGKKLAKGSTNELPKVGFDGIALKVIFQGLKRSEKGQIWVFCYFLLISQKLSDNFFGIQLLGNDIDQLSRERFD